MSLSSKYIQKRSALLSLSFITLLTQSQSQLSGSLALKLKAAQTSVDLILPVTEGCKVSITEPESDSDSDSESDPLTVVTTYYNDPIDPSESSDTILKKGSKYGPVVLSYDGYNVPVLHSMNFMGSVDEKRVTKPTVEVKLNAKLNAELKLYEKDTIANNHFHFLKFIGNGCQ